MSNSLLTIHQITREAIQQLTRNNAFLTDWDGAFNQPNVKIGSQLRIRLPSDYPARDEDDLYGYLAAEADQWRTIE